MITQQIQPGLSHCTCRDSNREAASWLQEWLPCCATLPSTCLAGSQTSTSALTLKRSRDGRGNSSSGENCSAGHQRSQSWNKSVQEQCVEGRRMCNTLACRALCSFGHPRTFWKHDALTQTQLGPLVRTPLRLQPRGQQERTAIRRAKVPREGDKTHWLKPRGRLPALSLLSRSQSCSLSTRWGWGSADRVKSC